MSQIDLNTQSLNENLSVHILMTFHIFPDDFLQAKFTLNIILHLFVDCLDMIFHMTLGDFFGAKVTLKFDFLMDFSDVVLEIPLCNFLPTVATFYSFSIDLLART